MKNKIVTIWIIVSFGSIAFSYLLNFFDADPALPSYLNFGGWLSSLVAVGYYVTAPETTNGKISFAGVVIMTLGIALKIFHWVGANEVIIAGLMVMAVPFAFVFFRKKIEHHRSKNPR